MSHPFNRPAARTIRTAPHRYIPTLEAMEERLVLSTIVVTNSTDTHVSGQISLREAIISANAAIEPTTILFDSSVQSIILQGDTGGTNGLYLTNTNHAITILGPTDFSPIVEASGQTGLDHINHIFYIAPRVNATISNLWIVDGFDENPLDGGAGMLNYGTVTLTNCNFNGNVAYQGAALLNAGSATLTNCSFSGNTVVYGGFSDDVGGAIFNGYSAAKYYGPGTMSLTDCTISGNYANQYGGGLYNGTASKADLFNCTLSDNTAGDGGGLFNKGEVALTNCTLSGNAVSGAGEGNGGGLYNSGTANLTNCTVSGNTGDNGGGLFNSSLTGTATLINCTVSGNAVSGSGGGLYNDDSVTLTNTIVAGNTAGSGPDVYTESYNNSNVTSLGYNLIGMRDGSTGWVDTDLTGTIANPLSPLLATLGHYGGPTKTMPLLPGSPAFAAGRSGSGIPTTDQRGQPRSGSIERGAFQSGGFVLAPVAGSTPQSVEVGQAFPHTLNVTVKAINPIEPVDGGVVYFNAPDDGPSAEPSGVSVFIANGQAGLTAVANFTLGAFTFAATAGGAASASFALTNTEAPSLVVTTNHDLMHEVDGLTSLREAIAYANIHPGPDTITFHPATFSGKSPRTIRIVGGTLVLTDPATTTIHGAGANLLTFQGNGLSRVFDVQGGSAAMSGLTIAGGRANVGGGLLNDGGTLVLTRVVLRDNVSRSFGGGLFNAGRTRLDNVLVRGNHARTGGGIANFGTLAMTRVNFHNNHARVACGLFNRHAATLIKR